MKLEIESFWTLTAFGGTRTVFMHWKDGGDYVESLNPFEAERFRSKKELADYLKRDESAKRYVESHRGYIMNLSRIRIEATITNGKWED